VVFNKSREVSRIVFSGRNASHEKQLETETREQAENLKRQEKMLHDAEKELANRLKDVKAELSLQIKAVEKLKGIHEAINDESPAGMVVTGSDNRIIFFNRTAEKIWNRDRSGVLDQDVSILFSDQLIEENEIIGSFTRPGDVKITGKIVKAEISDGSGRKSNVMLMLGRNRIDNENSFAAYLLPI
jgi:PAS domain S-box-containing protein